MSPDLKHTSVTVRNVSFKLVTYTRSLELCARMNYETENLDFIDRMPKGSVMYDLGACEGRFSVYAAKQGIRVFSFEPEAKNFTAFTQNLQLNELGEDRVVAVNAGVGAADGTAVMDIGQPWEGGHQKVVNHGEVRHDLGFSFVDHQQIQLVSIDRFVANGHPTPQFMKVDIDGSEMPFLRGAMATLKSPELREMLFELSETDPHFQDVVDILNACGLFERGRYQVPNEPNLYNVLFTRESAGR